MEQQWSQEKTGQKAEQDRQTTREKIPERERIADAGFTALAVLSGAAMQDLSVSRLEELASFIGNSAMVELMNAQGGETATVSFQLPEGGLETAAYPVPSGAPALATPVGLTGEMSAGRAFDPGGLRG